MLVLASEPAAVSGLLPPGTARADWRRADDADPDTSALWDALGGTCAPWVLALQVPSPLAFWSRLAILIDAERSPFDALRGRLGSEVAAAGPVACLSLAGRALHGFHGREWVAAPGNLHLSVAFAPGLPASCLPALVMLPAVAVRDAVVAATDGAIRPGIKWVSDVLVDEGKIAGVLTATHVRGSDVDLAVLGIGLNVTTAPGIAPTPFVPSSGCLRQHEGGAEVTVGDMLWHVLTALANRLARLRAQGPETLVRDYVRASLVIGRRVRVWDERAAADADPVRWRPPRAAGLVVGIDTNLALSLHGTRDPVGNGRLAFEEDCRAFGV
jgi:biotin-[acetyl-CoA-carboxylase] ligase BirA-like protein